MSYNILIEDFLNIGYEKNYYTGIQSKSQISELIRNATLEKSKININKINDFTQYEKELKTHLILRNIFKLNNLILVNDTTLIKEETSLPANVLKMKPTDLLVNRNNEVKLLKVMLHKHRRGNILVVGEAGVGKTELVSSIASKENIVALDLAGLLSGTNYRGSFEKKLKAIIEFCKDEKKVLFIDEIHSLYNVGLSEGGISALDILKPDIATSKLKIIGATTYEELNTLLKDSAFMRRFTILKIAPLSKHIIIKNSEDLLSIFPVKFEKDAQLLLLEKADNIYNKSRLLDGYLDMCDTISSLANKECISSISVDFLNSINYIWEFFYDTKIE